MTLTIEAPNANANAYAALGTDISGSGSAHQALIDSKLAGMNVTKAPLTTPDGEVVEGQFALVDAEGKPLPNITVGAGFTVVQYEQVCEALDAVAAHTGATFESAAALDVRAYGIGGARAYIAMVLPDQISIGGVDPVEARLVAFMSHGTTSNVLAPTATRIYCANQQPQVQAEDTYRIVIRHTSSAPVRTAAAEKVLTAAVGSMRQMAVQGEEMLAHKIGIDRFTEIVERLYPIGGDSKSAKTRSDKRIDMLQMIYQSDTQDPIRDTAWGAYQAILEYGEHYQGGKRGEGSLSVARARRALTSGSLAAKQLKAFRMIRELVGLN